MKKTTIKEWVSHFMNQYPTKEDFKIDLNRIIQDCIDDKTSPNQLVFYKRIRAKLAKIEIRLEELRNEIQAECISTGELIELQGLAKYIDRGDVELLEWAGVPEFEN